MIDIGINYITEKETISNKYDNIYKFLVKKGYINTIKYPGRYCDLENLKNVIKISQETKSKLDVHGLPQMVSAIYSEDFIKNIEWNKLKIKNIARISTHMGLKNGEKLNDYSEKELEDTFKNNIKKLKSNIKELTGRGVEFGLENIPGGFQFDLDTIKPEFVGDNWEKVDFGIFDIAHAKLSAKELKITYKEYIDRLKNKDKVKILHVSGNIDETNKYANKPDKHVLINKNEINDIIEAIKTFKNIDLVVSEYAYNTKYSIEKELLIEAIVLSNIVKTMDEHKSQEILEHLEKNLENDISNIECIMKY